MGTLIFLAEMHRKYNVSLKKAGQEQYLSRKNFPINKQPAKKCIFLLSVAATTTFLREREDFSSDFWRRRRGGEGEKSGVLHCHVRLEGEFLAFYSPRPLFF